MRLAGLPWLMFLLSVLASPALAEQFVLKEYNAAGYTYTNVADTKLYSNAPYSQYAYGGLETTYGYMTGYIPLVRFDLSAIPNVNKVALVNSATLRLYRTSASGSGSITVSQLAQDWVEGTAKGNGGDVCDGAMWYTWNAGTFLPKTSLVSAGTNLWYFDGVVGVADDPITAGKKHIRPNNNNYGNSNTGTGMTYTHCDNLAALQALPTTTRAYYWDAAAGRLYLNKNDYGVRYYTLLDYWTTPGAPVVGSPIGYTTAPAAPAWVEWDVAPIVRNWLVEHQGNYGFRLIHPAYAGSTYASSEAVDPTLRPELVVDVTYYDLPGTPSDLAAGSPDWFKLDLTWTAPSSNPPGPVATYDIRYSTTAITSEADFQAATPCTGEPDGAAPGTSQTFTVTGLAADTAYWFALKAIDGAGQIGPMSNVATGRTSPPDVIAPAAVTDLSASDIKPIRATLSWTAPADDGNDPATGPATSQEIRYSTSPLDESTWSAATIAAGVPNPGLPGSTETFILRNLSPETTYHVAIKTVDEAGNFSPISNTAGFTTPASPAGPPPAITNLQVAGTHIQAAVLTWSAPTPPANATLAAYDVRYSTSPIDDGNWDAAAQAAGEPAPSDTGAAETFTVTGLQPDTTYYFAIKTLDESEPPLVSPLSNVAAGKTRLPIVPVTVHNPWIANDRVADCRTLQTMGATFGKAYTPDGVVVPAPTDIQTQAINEYNNFKRRWYHWGESPPETRDVVTQLNVFGWYLCGSQAAMNAAVLEAMGLSPRVITIDNGGHTIFEVYYNNKWHCLDTMTTYYVYDRSTPRQIASMADVKADNSLVLNAVAEGRACPGFLLCGDTPQYFATGSNSWQVIGTPGSSATTKSMNMDLRLGEAFKRTCESWVTQYYNNPTNTPPYHHESQGDYKDTVNILYWEPYAYNTAQNAAIGITKSVTYRRWANGTYEIRPDFRSAGYQASLASSANIATYNDDGLTPDLHTAAVGSLASIVVNIATPFYITDLNISGAFVRNTANDINRIYVSSTSATSGFTKIWDNTATGTTQLNNLNARTQAFGKYSLWVKIELQATTAKTDAGVSDLVIAPTFEHNKGGMPYLDKGLNNLTLTFDNAAELQASRNVLHVVYRWKENNGSGWNVDRQYEGWFAASPSTFTISVGGTKVPRTESILMEVLPPLDDFTPPAVISDLHIVDVGSNRVTLAWTATGDDGSTGTAMAYDLRYSPTPIVDDATFEAATRVAGVPAPKPAGSAEAFTVLYLPAGASYYFAIKAIDKGNNSSPLSNVVSVTPPPRTGISDLAAGAPGSARVPLTWTAINDGALGTYAAYDLRYSTAPIVTDADFAAAAPVTGVPVPKEPGQAEAFTVMYLQPSTTYWFAVKAVDIGGNRSPLSNVVSATTTAAAAITDLDDIVIGFNKAYLAWTAIDDGSTGTAAAYNMRYSTTPITDDASFDAATAVAGVPAPKPAGQAETFTLTGLSPLTTYWIAIKAVDAMGRSSPLSNILMIITTDPDLVPPEWVGDLKGTPSQTARGVDLAWTAPADYGPNNSGPFPCTTYELRYSTSPIAFDDGGASWNAATVVPGLPAPKAPGAAETFTVSLPAGNTTYYFAIRSRDEGVPPNASEVSNCAPAASSMYGQKVLQEGLSSYAGTRDAYFGPTTRYDTGNLSITGYAAGGATGNIQRAVLRFDVTSVPADMAVVQATLSLYAYDAAYRRGSTGFYGAYPLTRDWNEVQVSWTLAATGVSWTTPGGDFLATPDATSPKQAVAGVWYPFDVTARVQTWLAGTTNNFGWMVKCTNEDLSNQDRFYSSEGTGGTVLRPKLVISDVPAAVPGDISGDGSVDVEDLLYLVDSFGATCQLDRNYDPRCDFNNDKSVDVVDLLDLVEYWPE